MSKGIQMFLNALKTAFFVFCFLYVQIIGTATP